MITTIAALLLILFIFWPLFVFPRLLDYIPPGVSVIEIRSCWNTDFRQEVRCDLFCFAASRLLQVANISTVLKPLPELPIHGRPLQVTVVSNVLALVRNLFTFRRFQDSHIYSLDRGVVRPIHFHTKNGGRLAWSRYTS